NLRFRKQPGPTGEPSISCCPNGQLRPRLRVSNLLYRVQVHGYANAFSKMHLLLKSLARPAPILGPIGMFSGRLGWSSHYDAANGAISKDGGIMDQKQPIWIRDPLSILADVAERGIVVQGGKIVDLVPRGREPSTANAAVYDA